MTRRMTLSLILLVLLAIAVYAGIRTLQMRRLIRAGQEISRNGKPFERIKKDGRPRILILGDSTAVGIGSTPKGSIAGRFAADFPGAEVINRGISGLRTGQLASAFPSFEPKSFDLVMLQIGANDVVNGTPLPEFARSLGVVFDYAKALSDNVVALHSGNVGVAPIFPWPLSAIMDRRTVKLREVYKPIAEEKGVVYVDLYRTPREDFFHGEHKYYGVDLFHLSDAGYGKWYDFTREAMESAGMTTDAIQGSR